MSCAELEYEPVPSCAQLEQGPVPSCAELEQEPVLSCAELEQEPVLSCAELEQEPVLSCAELEQEPVLRCTELDYEQVLICVEPCCLGTREKQAKGCDYEQYEGQDLGYADIQVVARNPKEVSIPAGRPTAICKLPKQTAVFQECQWPFTLRKIMWVCV